MADEPAPPPLLSGTTLLPDLNATQQLARSLAFCIKPGDFIALHGSLGTGKTEFARFLLRATGVTGDVPSPTFTLLQSYDTDRGPIHHLDLYRLKSEDELDELGWDDLTADGVTLVEWPERAKARLPVDRLDLFFDVSNDRRSCKLEPRGAWAARHVHL